MRPAATRRAPFSIPVPSLPVPRGRARTSQLDSGRSDATVVTAAHVQHRPAHPVATRTEQVADGVGDRLRAAETERVALQVSGPAGGGERLPGAAGRAGGDRV